MSEFTIEIRKVSRVYNHNNADLLELCNVEDLDFQFVVRKDVLKEGDLVLHFPLASIIPDNILMKIGLSGKLSGASKNRVKTVRLRSALSQGLVIPLDDMLEFLPEDYQVGVDYREILGVEKYDPDEEATISGRSQDPRLRSLPQFLFKYDIEGADNHKHIAELLMDEPVIITEKLEGSNYPLAFEYTYEGPRIIVNSRKHSIIELENEPPHVFIELAKEKYNEVLIKVKELLKPVHNITIWGEIIGPKVQGNIYKLTENEVRFFDIYMDGRFVDAERKFDIFDSIGENLTVPILNRGVMTLREWLAGKSIKSASDGISIFKPELNILREGIVISPLQERHVYHFGRLILKQRSPEYLLKYDT